MSSIKDVTLGEFANLSYIELPFNLEEKVDKEEVSLKDLADSCIDEYVAEEKSGEISYQEQDILNVLRKCQSGEYKDYKIVDYYNDNGKSGFVGYAIETNTGELIIASRGSESPEKDTNKGWEDWIDNVEISTHYETIQQKAAKDFVNGIGRKYDSIYLTGHSKGGNNALYSAITADYDVRSKIKNCVTFNAPGFSDKFIKEQKFVIDQLNKNGVFKEYQGGSDLVSSIMNNVSSPLVVSQKDLDKTFSERLKGFDDHYIYAMEIDGDNFVLENNGKKALIPIIVNNLVAGLTETLTDKEIDELIALTDKIINKDEDTGTLDILKMILDSGVDISTANIILLEIITEAGITLLKETPIIDKKGVVYVAELFIDTEIFIYSNLARMKNYIKDGLVSLRKSIIKQTAKLPNTVFKVSVASVVGENAFLGIKDLYNNGISTNKCLATIDDISTALNVYKVELTNIKYNLKRMDLALEKLVQSGWRGEASQRFYSARFITFKGKMGTLESQITYMVKYLEKAKKEFESRKLEEDSLIAALA